MNKHYNAVTEFMLTAGQEVLDNWTPPSPKLGTLRINLIEEEIKELKEDGILDDNIVEVADALGDILVVTYGAYAALGLGKFMEQFYIPEIDSNSSIPTLSYSYSLEIIESFETMLNNLKCAMREGKENLILLELNNIIKNVYQTSVDYNININDVFDIIHESNMSKFVKTEEDVNKSISDLIVNRKIKNENDAYYDEVGDYLVIKRKSDGKVLKGRWFHEPELKKVL